MEGRSGDLEVCGEWKPQGQQSSLLVGLRGDRDSDELCTQCDGCASCRAWKLCTLVGSVVGGLGKSGAEGPEGADESLVERAVPKGTWGGVKA